MLTALNTTVPSTQKLTSLLVLHFLERGKPLTEWELAARIRTLGGELYWRPSKGTISKVVRDLLAEGQVNGEWKDLDGRRKRPLLITDAGRARLRVLREQLREPLLAGRRMLERTLREIYRP